MKEQCRLVGKPKLAEKYHKRISSPLLTLFREALIFLRESMRHFHSKSIRLLVDSFSDSHGIDADEVVKSIQELESLDVVTSVERVDSDDTPLVQAADLLGSFAFREFLLQHRGDDPDHVLEGIRARYPFGGMSAKDVEKMNRKVRLNYGEMSPPAQGVFYLVARRVIESAYPEFAEKYMVTVDELMERWRIAAAEDHNGVSILKDPSVCRHLIP